MPPAVAFLELFERRQRELDDMSLVPLAQIDVSVYLVVLCYYALISTFILRRELTIERGVHFYTTVSFYTSRTHSSTISLASSNKTPQLNVIKVYHCTCQYTVFKRGVDFSLDERSFVATRVFATRIPAINVHGTSLQL